MVRFIRHLCMVAGLICALTLPAMANPQSDMAGQQWLASTQEEKLAFLYGAASVVAIEQAVAQKNGTQPSIFVEKWMKTFGNDTLTGVCSKLDKWYDTHPGAHSRQIFDVLWYEFMAPGTKK